MPGSDRTIIGSAIVPFRMVFLMWLVFIGDFQFNLGLYQYGLVPRTAEGLIGILTAPLLHNVSTPVHIISNTVPMLFLGAVLFFYYNSIARQVFFQCYIVTNILVWIFARQVLTIGASGVIYGLASFLIFFGLFKRNFMTLTISVIVVVLYGSLIYGIFPTYSWVSYESHLAGALVGLISAFQMRNKKIE